MPMFSCHLALTFGLKNLRILEPSDITVPRAELGLRVRVLRKPRRHENKKISVPILVA